MSHPDHWRRVPLLGDCMRFLKSIQVSNLNSLFSDRPERMLPRSRIPGEVAEDGVAWTLDEPLPPPKGPAKPFPIGIVLGSSSPILSSHPSANPSTYPQVPAGHVQEPQLRRVLCWLGDLVLRTR